jgi:DNA-binding beta-propeller fold protein YncE
MTRLTTILIMIARFLGVAQIVTGFAFWFGWMPDTSPHFGMGSLLVLVVWIIALIGLFALPKRGVALMTLLWGGLVLWFGMAQTTFLVGSAHWIIRVAHLLVGVSMLGLAESIAKAVKTHAAARAAAAVLLLMSLAAPARAQNAQCNEPPAQPSVTVKVPGNPFQALPTADGCWVFVSMPQSPTGIQAIGVLQRKAGTLTFVRALPVVGGATGMTLTHDQKMLIVAAGQRIIFIDAPALIAGRDDALLGYMDEPNVMGRVYANVTRDDKYLLIADERSQTVSVIDLPKANATHFSPSAVIGKIPTGFSPIALTLNADETLMFVTSQRAPDNFGWPIACKREGSTDTTLVFPNAAIHVVDMVKAKTDPAHAILHSVRAGCSAVRLVLSPSGDRAYVSARNSNALLVFDTHRLRNDPNNALLRFVAVGAAPVGIAVVDQGRKVIVTNSNRFAGDSTDRQSLNVIDATTLFARVDAVIGQIPAGAFPREMRVTPDGRALILTNFGSSTVQMIDLARLPIAP